MNERLVRPVGWTSSCYASDESSRYTVAMSLRRPTMDSYDCEEYDGEGWLVGLLLQLFRYAKGYTLSNFRIKFLNFLRLSGF